MTNTPDTNQRFMNTSESDVQETAQSAHEDTVAELIKQHKEQVEKQEGIIRRLGDINHELGWKAIGQDATIQDLQKRVAELEEENKDIMLTNDSLGKMVGHHRPTISRLRDALSAIASCEPSPGKFDTEMEIYQSIAIRCKRLARTALASEPKEGTDAKV